MALTLIDQIRRLLGLRARRQDALGHDAQAARARQARHDLHTPRPWPAADAARRQSEHGPRFGKNECELRCRLAFGVPSVGDLDGDGMADAEDGWKASRGRHPLKAGDPIPGCFPVFWSGGSRDNWHVAISEPRRPGHVWSTDIRREGFFDLVPIEEIHDKWGLDLLGYAEIYNGHRISHGKAL